VVRAPGRRILVLNLDPQEGETGGFSPAEHIDAITQQAPEMRFDVVIADPAHVGLDRARRDLADACAGWNAEVAYFDVAGVGDQHDPAKLAKAFGTVLA
jgi:2-phospho-L-lactate transferase/gluconeogenesis factor (CofD/UPF0052 family)